MNENRVLACCRYTTQAEARVGIRTRTTPSSEDNRLYLRLTPIMNLSSVNERVATAGHPEGPLLCQLSYTPVARGGGTRTRDPWIKS